MLLCNHPLLFLFLSPVLAVVIPPLNPAPESQPPTLSWHHPPDHPVHRLFKRDPPSDGANYPAIGSSAWRAAYPQSTPDTTSLPDAWVTALNNAVAAGSIPNIPPSTGAVGKIPRYPPGNDPTGSAVCSATYGCRSPLDFYNAPTGYFGTGFDDGPTDASPVLYKFLQQNNITATHFMIGIQILSFPQSFQFVYDTLQGDFGVHTWTHPMMTTLTNLEVVGQLGWTMQLMHDSTGGRVPRFWRPPYGDSDNRIRAIAREVFGLQGIIWNHDSGDWTLTQPNGTTLQAINNSFRQWLSGPKSPGLIVLEHELSNLSVEAFINNYPSILANGWTPMSVTQLIGNGSVYQNSNNTFSPVTMVSGVLPVDLVSTTSALSPTTTANTTAATAKPTNTLSSWGVVASTVNLPRVVLALLGVIVTANPGLFT